jgi:redox-sensing transcriptional repressor
MKYLKVPEETIRRLPMYLRALQSLDNNGTKSISSLKLSEYLLMNSWQIRKDLSYFGPLGKQGVGYNVKKLITQISKTLKLDGSRKVALIGLGNLGHAILAYRGFNAFGFEIAAIFDSDPKKIGTKSQGLVVRDVSGIDQLKQENINLAVIAVPASAAQEIADSLVKADVKGILNFSPCRLNVPKKVKLIAIDIATDLASLPYYIPVA